MMQCFDRFYAQRLEMQTEHVRRHGNGEERAARSQDAQASGLGLLRFDSSSIE